MTSIEGAILAAFIAFCRVGGCFMVMPGLGSVRVPVQIRLFIAIAATLALLPHLWDRILPSLNPSPAVLVPMIGSELLIGGLIGLMARIYVLALRFIAAAIAMLVGYGGMGGSSIDELDAQASLAEIISFSALLLLFIFDFHHEIIRALVLSYGIAPLNIFFNPQAALVDISDTLSEAFFIMIRLGSPFVAYAILVNLAIAFVNKLTPQIPIYFVSMPFVITGGLVILYFAVGTLLSLFADGFIPTTLGR